VQPDQNTPVLSPSQPGAQLTPPPAGLLGDAKLDAAFAEHRDLAAAADSARAAARNLENSRQVAIEADDKALGAALRSGEPDPGQKAQRYIEQAIVTARRTAAGLESAFGDSRTELLAMLAKRQEAIAEHIDAQLAAETESLIAVVREQLRSGLDQQARLRAARVWLDQPARHYNLREPVLPPLRGPNGEPLPLGHVLAALEAIVSPPVREVPPEPSRDQRTWTPAAA
jgi:hypothetical protein